VVCFMTAATPLILTKCILVSRNYGVVACSFLYLHIFNWSFFSLDFLKTDV